MTHQLQESSMKTRIISGVLIALSLSVGTVSVSQAQERNGRDGQQRDDHGPGARGPDRRAPPPPMRQPVRDVRHDERGAGPDHEFRRGGRLPNEFRGRQYVVDDWRNHHLNAPPRGYHWVQTGADYVLVAIATGLIAQVLLNQ
jgi:Ni/Co efflux regulator RcnB